ncbi:MAG: hypothetical protein KDC87_18060 [Planctomycetes bacterium]|nr:hypothetical protein [Planctomycetota bacterium]
MRIHLLLGALGVAAVAGTLALRPGSPDAPPPPSSALAPPADIGHLILQLEGDVRALQVVHLTPKPSAFNPTYRPSPFSIDLYDQAGNRLGSYPLDLSRFDTDPLRVGQPLRVEGCEVRDPHIAMLANIPYLPDACSIRICRGDKELGRLENVDYQRMLTAGVNR